jgi:hypothetical protein
MDAAFEKLGISEETLAFFNISQPVFHYGGDVEYYSINYHRVPTTPEMWFGGNFQANNIILSNSVIEMISYYNIHATNAFYISLGNQPLITQLTYLRSKYGRRKITVLFGNDITGRLQDIYAAASIRSKPLQMQLNNEVIEIVFDSRQYDFDPHQLSLNAFEKATKFRSGIRTRKSKSHTTFFNQLLSHE